jgi:hypothetical protein
MRWRTQRAISNFAIWHCICVKIGSSSGFTMGCTGTERLDGIEFQARTPGFFSFPLRKSITGMRPLLLGDRLTEYWTFGAD